MHDAGRKIPHASWLITVVTSTERVGRISNTRMFSSHRCVLLYLLTGFYDQQPVAVYIRQVNRMNTGGYVLLSCLYTHVCVCAEMEMGQWVWVMGQMGHHF